MRWHCWERDRAKGLFLQLQQRLHLLLYLVTPHSPARCQAAHGTGEPPHCTPARKRGESGTKTGRGRQRQWSWCHVGKGGDWISHLPEELGWAGLGKLGLLLCADSSMVPMVGTGFPTLSILPQ